MIGRWLTADWSGRLTADPDSIEVAVFEQRLLDEERRRSLREVRQPRVGDYMRLMEGRA